jgi:hypothetical protein
MSTPGNKEILDFHKAPIRAPLSFLEGERYTRCSVVERIVPRGSPGSGKLQKSHREFGNPRYPLARGVLSLFVRPLFVIFVVFIFDRQLMTRSEGYRVSVRKFFAARLMEATKKPNPQLQRHIRQATKRQNLPLPACGADRLSFGSSI